MRKRRHSRPISIRDSRDVDIVEGTPLLDTKPYIPEIDIREVERIGWLEKNVPRVKEAKDNGRFMKC